MGYKNANKSYKKDRNFCQNSAFPVTVSFFQARQNPAPSGPEIVVTGFLLLTDEAHPVI